MRKRLTRNEEREYLAYARTMQEEGVSLEIPDEWLEHSRLLDSEAIVEQCSSPFECPVFRSAEPGDAVPRVVVRGSGEARRLSV